ncbi:unnamed protein product [[Candida] boidinii]|nr:unnamed protein product [[Candida] boidinii]
MINNFKVGVYSNSLSNLPIDEADIESINPSPEFFPTTTSHKNWLLAVDSFYQLTRIHKDGCGIITKETEDLLWMSLEFDSDNKSLRTLFQTWLENSMSVITTDNEHERFGWFEKLISHFNMPKHKLYDSLFRLYKTRINSSGMFFNNIDISSTSKVIDFSAVKASAADDDDDDDIENPDVLGEDDIALTTDAGDNNQDSSNGNK